MLHSDMFFLWEGGIYHEVVCEGEGRHSNAPDGDVLPGPPHHHQNSTLLEVKTPPVALCMQISLPYAEYMICKGKNCQNLQLFHGFILKAPSSVQNGWKKKMKGNNSKVCTLLFLLFHSFSYERVSPFLKPWNSWSINLFWLFGFSLC